MVELKSNKWLRKLSPVVQTLLLLMWEDHKYKGIPDALTIGPWLQKHNLAKKHCTEPICEWFKSKRKECKYDGCPMWNKGKPDPGYHFDMPEFPPSPKINKPAEINSEENISAQLLETLFNFMWEGGHCGGIPHEQGLREWLERQQVPLAYVEPILNWFKTKIQEYNSSELREADPLCIEEGYMMDFIPEAFYPKESEKPATISESLPESITDPMEEVSENGCSDIRCTSPPLGPSEIYLDQLHDQPRLQEHVRSQWQKIHSAILGIRDEEMWIRALLHGGYDLKYLQPIQNYFTARIQEIVEGANFEYVEGKNDIDDIDDGDLDATMADNGMRDFNAQMSALEFDYDLPPNVLFDELARDLPPQPANADNDESGMRDFNAQMSTPEFDHDLPPNVLVNEPARDPPPQRANDSMSTPSTVLHFSNLEDLYEHIGQGGVFTR